jgi:dTMP kinase
MKDFHLSHINVNNMSKGLFIALEGTDGSGKTIQTELLLNHLKKEERDVVEVSFPQYGQPSAAMVEAYLNGKFGAAEEVGPHCASIFFAINRYDASQQIKQWLGQKKIVLANRYVASNMGHQGGKIKNLEERRKYFEWNYDLEYNIFKIPKPDVNIILHVTPEVSQELVDKKEEREYLKGKKRDIHEDDLNHLRDAEEAFVEIANTYPEFQLIECIENNKILPPEEIHKKIWNIIQKYL